MKSFRQFITENYRELAKQGIGTIRDAHHARFLHLHVNGGLHDYYHPETVSETYNPYDPNTGLKRGDRVVATKDSKQLSGGDIKKGSKGTYHGYEYEGHNTGYHYVKWDKHPGDIHAHDHGEIEKI